MNNTNTIKVNRSQNGFSLRQVLKECLELSSKQINRYIDNGQVFVNKKKETHGSSKLRSGDLIECNINSSDKTQSKKPVKIEVLFEDDDFYAINKPPGIPSQKTKDAKRITIESLIHNECRKRNEKPYILLHRLDRDTSGVLLFAKHKSSSQIGFELFKHREIKKEYIALCKGNLHPKSGKWENYLDKKGKRSGKDYYESVRSGGMPAKTSYNVLEQSKMYSLVHLKPHTGRTHQLRVHLSEAKAPIVGDTLYDTRQSDQISHHLLHAYKLFIPSENPVEISAPFPDSFTTFADQCQLKLPK
jgi:23S rRNA pseudouridine1911/1915/1917 synthase